MDSMDSLTLRGSKASAEDTHSPGPGAEVRTEATAALPNGARVRVSGLKSREDLNGREAAVVTWHADKARFPSHPHIKAYHTQFADTGAYVLSQITPCSRLNAQLEARKWGIGPPPPSPPPQGRFSVRVVPGIESVLLRAANLERFANPFARLNTDLISEVLGALARAPLRAGAQQLAVV